MVLIRGPLKPSDLELTEKGLCHPMINMKTSILGILGALDSIALESITPPKLRGNRRR
jgi:hypothetical protein